MIRGVNLSNYYRMAQISNTLNKFMREITITKAHISSTLKSAFSHNDIGNNVDLLI